MAALLELHGIRACLQNECSYWTIGFPTAITPFEILIHEHAREKAVEVLRETFLGKSEDCGRFFTFTREEDRTLAGLVSEEREGRRLAWWWVVALMGTEMFLPLLFIWWW